MGKEALSVPLRVGSDLLFPLTVFVLVVAMEGSSWASRGATETVYRVLAVECRNQHALEVFCGGEARKREWEWEFEWEAVGCWVGRTDMDPCSVSE